MVPSPLDLRVLHGIRLKGFVSAPFSIDLPWFDAVGDSPVLIEQELAKGVEEGLVRFRDGSRPGWSLTDRGRKAHDLLLAIELQRTGLRPQIESAYRDFSAINGRMLEVCTKWQVIDSDSQKLNQHDDPAYDAEIIGRLREIDEAVQPVCAALAGLLDRFKGYGERFSVAIKHVVDGDIDWFTKPTIDSYHTVWFELHEDLLVTLGTDRASERA